MNRWSKSTATLLIFLAVSSSLSRANEKIKSKYWPEYWMDLISGYLLEDSPRYSSVEDLEPHLWDMHRAVRKEVIPTLMNIPGVKEKIAKGKAFEREYWQKINERAFRPEPSGDGVTTGIYQNVLKSYEDLVKARRTTGERRLSPQQAEIAARGELDRKFSPQVQRFDPDLADSIFSRSLWKFQEMEFPQRTTKSERESFEAWKRQVIATLFKESEKNLKIALRLCSEKLGFQLGIIDTDSFQDAEYTVDPSGVTPVDASLLERASLEFTEPTDFMESIPTLVINGKKKFYLVMSTGMPADYFRFDLPDVTSPFLKRHDGRFLERPKELDYLYRRFGIVQSEIDRLNSFNREFKKLQWDDPAAKLKALIHKYHNEAFPDEELFDADTYGYSSNHDEFPEIRALRWEGYSQSPSFWRDRENEARRLNRPNPILKHPVAIGEHHELQGGNVRKIPLDNISLQERKRREQIEIYQLISGRDILSLPSYFELFDPHSSHPSIAVQRNLMDSVDNYTWAVEPTSAISVSHPEQIIVIPGSLGSRLSGLRLHLHGESTPLLQGKDYEILEQPQFAAYAVKLKSAVGQKVEFRATFEEDHNPLPPASPISLSVSELHAIAKEAAQQGLSKIAEGLLRAGLGNSHLGLAQIGMGFRDGSRYSHHRTHGVTGPSDPFEIARSHLFDGYFCSQCAGTSALFAKLFADPIARAHPGSQLESRTVLLRINSTTLTLGSYHARNYIVEEGRMSEGIDVTPSIPDPRENPVKGFIAPVSKLHEPLSERKLKDAIESELKELHRLWSEVVSQPDARQRLNSGRLEPSEPISRFRDLLAHLEDASAEQVPAIVNEANHQQALLDQAKNRLRKGEMPKFKLYLDPVISGLLQSGFEGIKKAAGLAIQLELRPCKKRLGILARP